MVAIVVVDWPVIVNIGWSLIVAARCELNHRSLFGVGGVMVMIWPFSLGDFCDRLDTDRRADRG
jgi:hypothetical protein